MLKKFETLGFVVIIFIIGSISIWRGRPLAPPSLVTGTPMIREVHKSLIMGNSIRPLLAKLLLDLQQGSSIAETFLSKIFFANFSKKISIEY